MLSVTKARVYTNIERKIKVKNWERNENCTFTWSLYTYRNGHQKWFVLQVKKPKNIGPPNLCTPSEILSE